jgi:hypothetical protein
MSKASETSNPHAEHRTGDGRFAKGNPGGPGRPRGAVRGAASALDRIAAEASAELIKVVLELACAGDREALKLVQARLRPPRRTIVPGNAPGNARGNLEKRIRALEDRVPAILRARGL